MPDAGTPDPSRDPSVADLPSGPAKTAFVRSMFDAIAPRYDVVNRLMTLGMDQRWRRATVRALGLPAGAVVLDLACGTGALGRLAQRAGYRTVGVDLSTGMLAAGSLVEPVIQGDSSALPLAGGSMDGIVCGYALRNFTDLAASLAEAARVLRPGGRIAILEVAAPPAGLLRKGYDVWFTSVVPRIGALLSDREAYRYLPRSTAYLPGEDGLRQLLRDAGFATVGHRLLYGGLSRLVTATREGATGAGVAPARPAEARGGEPAQPWT